MSSVRVFVNGHPAPDERRLAQITDATLRSLIELRRGETVGNGRLDADGVPRLSVLVAELLRREAVEAGVQR